MSARSAARAAVVFLAVLVGGLVLTLGETPKPAAPLAPYDPVAEMEGR